MTRKWSSVVALGVVLAQVALLACGSSAAQASTVISAQQRGAFEQSMARYARIESSTTPAEVRSQMRATEATIAPCVPKLKRFYEREATLASKYSSLPATFDIILGWGAEMRGERWNANAVIPLLTKRYVADVLRPSTTIAICSVITKWSTENYASADRPKIFEALPLSPGLSPYLVTGAIVSAATFRSEGYPKSTAKRLIDELSNGAARYSKLDALAGSQFIGWLQQQGVYQLMQPYDRRIVRF
jgi:hypothetical protein